MTEDKKAAPGRPGDAPANDPGEAADADFVIGDDEGWAAAPEERLVVLARPGPATIYRAEGTASAVTTASALLRDSLAVRQGGFSEAWILPNSYRSALVPFLAGIPERIGYATDGRRHLLTRAPAAPPRTSHQLRDYDRLLESRGIQPDEAPPRLPIPAEAAARADAALSRAGLPRNGSLALLAQSGDALLR